MDVKQLISDFSIGEKIELYNCLYTDLSGKGLGGDTELAHVNPEEMVVLRAMGGAGTVNPNTNLMQFVGGGGGGQQAAAPAVQTQVQQSEFPTELKPFIQDIFGKAQAIQENKETEGFQAFQGPLQAEFDPAQTKSFEQIEAIPGATKPLFDDATTLARSASGPLPTAEELQAASNPFVRNVIDIQKREAERVSDVQGQKQDAAASQAGAFGGSRAAILEAERQRNLNQQLGDIESQGQLAAFQDAQQRIASQRGREASGATQLAALGSAIPAQQLKELGALSGVGAARQTQAQRGIDLARQEFEAEEAFPSQTLQEFSSVLRGFPLAPTRSTTREQFSAAQPLSTQLLGVGTQALGALGASGAFKGAFGQAGGQVGQMPVKKYQGGGALNSLINNTEGLNTQPVIGMGSGGGIMDILEISAPAITQYKQFKKDGLNGLLNTHNPMFMADYHDKLLEGEPDAPPPPSIPAASRVISPEELAKQKDALLRAQAARGQQAAGAGAPRAQASSQAGNQVRQPFKEGGDLQSLLGGTIGKHPMGKLMLKHPMLDVYGKHPMLKNLMSGSGSAPPPPPAIPAASTVLSPEELAKQKDALLRAQAARGQQAAAAGAPRAQGSSQVGNQVRQSFKHGGGLRQMVNLPSNRVQFGKTAYQNVTEEEGFFAKLFDPRRTHVETFQGKPIKNIPHGLQNQELNMGLPRNNPIGGRFDTPVFDMKQLISEAPAALGGDKVQVEEAAELDIAPAPAAPKALTPKAPAPPAPKPTAEEVKLYRDPEEAAYASLIDSQAGQNAAKRYFAGENVGLANISEALKAYKGFKDTEMGQRQKINEANIKKAAAARATRSASLGDTLKMTQIANNQDAPAVARMKAASQGLVAIKDMANDANLIVAARSNPQGPEAQKLASLNQQIVQLTNVVTELTKGPSPSSMPASKIANLQVPLGADPAVQQLLANLTKQK